MASTTTTVSAAREAWGLFWQLAMEHRARLRAEFADLGLTFPQARALRVLDAERPLPMSELAQRLVCDASNVTGIVDRLESRGLVERQAGQSDRRVKMLALTPTGADARERISKIMTEPPPAVVALPEADQRALRDILRRAVERAETAV